MNTDINPRIGWLLYAGPSGLKVLMKWSGTNHPANPIWKALNFLEGGAFIFVLLAVGFWWGHYWVRKSDETLEKKFDQLLEDKIDRGLKRNSVEVHESYKNRLDERKRYEQNISSLKEELTLSQKKYDWLVIQYKELKGFKPRTAQDANEAALLAVTE